VIAAHRVILARSNMMLCAVGAFQIWRRDVLEEVNGFSTGPDLAACST
jgi:hypothetical protein